MGRAPHTKETLPDFHEKCRVTRHSRVFRGLTGSQRTPGFWGVTYHVLFHIVATCPCYTFHSSFSYLCYRILSYYMLLSCTFHIKSSCIIHILHIHLYVLILSYTLCFHILYVLFLYWFKANTFISYLYFSYYVNFYLIFHISRRSIRLILLLSYHILSYVFIYVFMCFHILYFSYTFLFSLLSILYLFISFSCTTLCTFYILYSCTVHVLFS